MVKGKITKREEDLLIHEWETLIHYWASDNTVVIIWSTIFMLVNSILLGGILSTAPNESILPDWAFEWFTPLMGIFINAIWFLGVSRFIVYIRHYESLAKCIQNHFPLFRFRDPELLKRKFRWNSSISTKPLFKCVPIIFLIAWIVMLVALN